MKELLSSTGFKVEESCNSTDVLSLRAVQREQFAECVLASLTSDIGVRLIRAIKTAARLQFRLAYASPYDIKRGRCVCVFVCNSTTAIQIAVESSFTEPPVPTIKEL